GESLAPGTSTDDITTSRRLYGPPPAAWVVWALARLDAATFIRVRSADSPDAETSMAVKKSMVDIRCHLLRRSAASRTGATPARPRSHSGRGLHRSWTARAPSRPRCRP